MTRDIHERAQQIIALAGAGTGITTSAKDEALSDADQTWLRAHLRECAACRDYQEAAGHALRALRSQPLAAGSALVRATQLRVRSRALELSRQRERLWLVSLSCLLVGLSAAITTPLFWRACQWIGEWAGVSSWVWQAGFAFSWITPGLVVGALLVARGTHPLNHGQNQWR
jgi:predicted anti-sigma-YlaC factor YlaD